MLGRPTLVLNRGWLPINVVSVRRALVMVYHGKARAIDPESYETYSFDTWTRLAELIDRGCIQSSRCTVPVPEVIILSSYNKIRYKQVSLNRRNLYNRDKGTCQYCGGKFTFDHLTVDHIVPLCQGGKTTWENCVTACMKCNSRKAGRTPEQAGMKLLKKPTAPPSKLDAGFHRKKVLPSWKKFVGQFLPDEEAAAC